MLHRFQPANYGTTILPLGLHRYRLASSPVLIQLLLLDFHDMAMSNFHNPNHVQQVWVEISAVGSLHESSMMATSHPCSHCAFSPLSVTRKTLLTLQLLVNFVSNLGYTFSLNHNRQDHILFGGHQSTWYGVYNFRLGQKTVAHALWNCHVSPFGDWNT